MKALRMRLAPDRLLLQITLTCLTQALARIPRNLARRVLLIALVCLNLTQAHAQVPFNLTAGWNLLGNSSAAPIDVTVTFGDATKITTVWKWNQAGGGKWAFYTPSLADGGAAFAASKGYDPLTSIASKEGFWVNASTAVALTGPVATGVTLVAGDLPAGWNLIGSADGMTPSQLNNSSLGSNLNAAATVIVTAWAWDTSTSAWKFYAPALEIQGGTVLSDYITSKGYLAFTSPLSAADGFWLNIGSLLPGAPTGVTAVAGTAQATVTFTPPASSGGSAITGYTVISSPGGITAIGTASPIVVSGLQHATQYTFAVTATNNVGSGAPSAASNSVTTNPAPTVPGAPTGVTAAAGNAQATVTFTAPANGGSAITGYTVISSPGGLTAIGTASPIVVSSLVNGTTYTFAVTATNIVGSGAPSAASNSVTPGTAPLAVSVTGAGTVSSSTSGFPNTITNCSSAGGSACSGTYLTTTPVTLTATAGANSFFTGWSGGGGLAGTCTGTASPCTLAAGATSVTATFATTTVLTVSVAGTGTGTITAGSVPAPAPTGIVGACTGPTCTGTYLATQAVTLTATAGANSFFTGWTGGGACNGTTSAACVLAAGTTAVTANFASTTVLTVTVAGTGTITAGAVSAPAPTGIVGTCSGPTCTGTYLSAQAVTLTATAGTGFFFTGWTGGACNGTNTNPCTLAAGTSAATANFGATTVLTVALAGTSAGTVTSANSGAPTGIASCSANGSAACTGTYLSATAVALTATAGANSFFTGWSGGGGLAGTCTGTTSSCTLAAGATGVTANFAATTVLTVSVNGTGTGTVTSVTSAAPTGIGSCTSAGGAVCSGTYLTATAVTLTATAGANSFFTGWTGGGACNGTTSATCALAAGATSVTATFVNLTPLSVSVAGGGTVASTTGIPGTIACDNTMAGYTGTCSDSFLVGGSVTLTATPSSGAYVFAGWFDSTDASTLTTRTGCSGTGTCTFTKAAAQYVTAIFAPTAVAPNPVLVYQDILSGPTTGGESNKGIYLSVFGKNIGTTGAGTTVKMYLDNIEVDNYRYVGSATKGRTDMQQLTVQVGSVGGAANNANLPIMVVADGRVSSTAAPSAALNFKVNPGNVYFVSLTGNDGTGAPNDIALPYRTVQKAAVNNTCPSAAGSQTVATAGVWGLVQPGDFIVMRGGTWTDVSKDGFFLRAQNKFGTLPTGVAGSGPITLMGYPGESVFIDRTNTAGGAAAGGGISSADSARQLLGCGARITVTNVKVESGFNDGMITTQNASANPNGSYWRVVNNEMTAISCDTTTGLPGNNTCKGAGVAGSGVGQYWVGNYVHDVYDLTGGGTNLENHGFYMDGVGSYEIAYNRIENIVGGNGIQTNSTSTPTTTNAVIHHNVIKGVGKHGINLSNGSATGFQVYNNVVSDTAQGGLRFYAGATGAGCVPVLLNLKVYNNTFYNTDTLSKGTSGSPAALMYEGCEAAGVVELRNNIVVPVGLARYIKGSNATGWASNAATMSNNLYFNGVVAEALAGTGNVLTDPLFVNAGAADFRLSAGSPAIGAGSAVPSALVVDDNDVANATNTQTLRGPGYDIGAYQYLP